MFLGSRVSPTALLSALLCLGCVFAAPAGAQLPAPPAAAQSRAERPPIAYEAALGLLAPIALYPDPVLAAVLEAATAPLDVIEAERFLARREKDPALQPDPEWGPAIVALLNHPELLRRMSEDLDWLRALGTAVVEDLPLVQRAIQRIRRGARALGLLVDTEFQRVVVEDDIVAIEPVDPDRVRLPVYDPLRLLASLPAEPAPAEPTTALAAPSEPALLPPPPKPTPPPPPVPAPAERVVEPPPAPTTAFVPPPSPAYEPYSAVPASPPPVVTYSEPVRSFWSDAAIFAGGAVLGGVLGYLLADRDDDKKIVKKYYYFGDRRPHWWWRERIDWRDDDWRPGRRIVKIDKVVIKDSNVYITGNDIVVRRLGERRFELERLRRSDEPEFWWEWPGVKERARVERVVVRTEPRPFEPALLPPPAPPEEREEKIREKRLEERPRIAVLPPRGREGEGAWLPPPDREPKPRRRERLEPVGPLPPAPPPAGALGVVPEDRGRVGLGRAEEERRRLERERRLEQKRLEEEQRRLARERAREQAEAERRAREERRLRALQLREERERREALEREERRRAAEEAALLRRQQEEAARLERERQRLAERALEEERRRAAEQAKLLRRQQEEAARLERERQRAAERALEEERRRAAEQAKLLRRQQEEAARLERERQRAAERALEEQRRRAAEQAEFLRRQREEAVRLERQRQREAERAERRRERGSEEEEWLRRRRREG
ncbi:MAG: DUF3300 domain-containing protein [Geminicoccaceae bacterium]|nr:DUF3300 domain-containing protein [Geminicoccaceae bacterium]